MADIRIGILALLAGVVTLASVIHIEHGGTLSISSVATLFASLGLFLVMMRTWNATKDTEECD
ncbi:MAG: hypothetical protein ACXQTL_03895 [Methanosarcinales archaeon]